MKRKAEILVNVILIPALIAYTALAHLGFARCKPFQDVADFGVVPGQVGYPIDLIGNENVRKIVEASANNDPSAIDPFWIIDTGSVEGYTSNKPKDLQKSYCR